MKQYISPEQLRTLTEKQKERLREWWESRISEENKYACHSKRNKPIENYAMYHGLRSYPDKLPLLSVGQCIELLGERDPGAWTINSSKSGGWYITSSNLYAPKYYISDGGKDFVELIDALWKAVKEVL